MAFSTVPGGSEKALVENDKSKKTIKNLILKYSVMSLKVIKGELRKAFNHPSITAYLIYRSIKGALSPSQKNLKSINLFCLALYELITSVIESIDGFLKLSVFKA